MNRTEGREFRRQSLLDEFSISEFRNGTRPEPHQTERSVDLVDHDDVDLAATDMVQQLLEGWAVQGGAGQAAIVISRADQPPAILIQLGALRAGAHDSSLGGSDRTLTWEQVTQIQHADLFAPAHLEDDAQYASSVSGGPANQWGV
jgi:hypothetical protein